MKAANWTCSYCNSTNSVEHTKCAFCGADYSERTDAKQNSTVEESISKLTVVTNEEPFEHNKSELPVTNEIRSEIDGEPLISKEEHFVSSEIIAMKFMTMILALIIVLTTYYCVMKFAQSGMLTQTLDNMISAINEDTNK